MSSHDESDLSVAHEFLRQLNIEGLCNVASARRQGLPCSPRNHTIGGFNIIQELAFEDGTTWLARIPRPDTCFQPEETILSYASVLRYLKKHSNIPVPRVFHYATSSDKSNKLGISYLLMNELPGHALPTLDYGEVYREPSPSDLRKAKKVHEQLTDIIIELASHQFSQIGALRELPSGTFTVVEYFDPYFTAYPEERAAAFRAMKSSDRGPYSSITEFYSSISKLNISQTANRPEDEQRSDDLADHEALAQMAFKFVLPEFYTGPFVIGHNDLTVQNILVDDDFNITGIIDFPGTVVPLPSLCIFPWLFHDNYIGAVARRQAYHDVFVSRVSNCQSSALGRISVRRQLMETALDRNDYERGLLGPYTGLVVPHLYESVYGKEYRRKGSDPEE